MSVGEGILDEGLIIYIDRRVGYAEHSHAV